jgi:MFS family permease
MKKRLKEHLDIKEKDGNKNIFLLGSSSLFNDVGSEMITPILPFLITSVGGAGIAVGLISGLREGLSSLFKLFGGWWSDRVGKKIPFVFLGYFLSVIFRAFLYFANFWTYIMGFVSLERVGKLRDAPRDAIISQSTKKQGKGFGIHQMMDTAGGIIGTLLVLFLFWKFGLELKNIILIAASVSLLSLVPLFFIKEKKSKPVKKSILRGFKDLNKDLKYFIFVASVFTFGNFGLYMFLLLRIKEITGNIIAPLIIYALFGLIYACFAVPFGNLSDKIGRKKVLAIGYVLFFIISVGLIFFSQFYVLASLFVLYGLVYAITQSNQKAFVSDLSKNKRATAFGIYGFIIGIVNIFGGLIAGIFWDISPITMFAYISVIALISAILLMFVKERKFI